MSPENKNWLRYTALLLLNLPYTEVTPSSLSAGLVAPSKMKETARLITRAKDPAELIETGLTDNATLTQIKARVARLCYKPEEYVREIGKQDKSIDTRRKLTLTEGRNLVVLSAIKAITIINAHFKAYPTEQLVVIAGNKEHQIDPRDIDLLNLCVAMGVNALLDSTEGGNGRLDINSGTYPSTRILG